MLAQTLPGCRLRHQNSSVAGLFETPGQAGQGLALVDHLELPGLPGTTALTDKIGSYVAE
jgi:hypothetical protein